MARRERSLARAHVRCDLATRRGLLDRSAHSGFGAGRGFLALPNSASTPRGWFLAGQELAGAILEEPPFPL